MSQDKELKIKNKESHALSLRRKRLKVLYLFVKNQMEKNNGKVPIKEVHKFMFEKFNLHPRTIYNYLMQFIESGIMDSDGINVWIVRNIPEWESQ